MRLHKNYTLKKWNSFGLDVKAEQFAEVRSEASLREAIALGIRPFRILGGGSNILLTKNVEGLLLRNNIKGIEVQRDLKTSVHVAVGGGENWHKFVLWSIQKGYGGIENLSLIPGTVGAAPIQNIGAYGVELKDVFLRLDAIDLKSGKSNSFSKKECNFGYRDSIFKRAAKGKYCITKVYFKLQKNPKVNLSYGAIKNTLVEMKVKKPTPKTVSKAVIAIRSSKLPDPKKLGNAGSFFKNPEISLRHFAQLKKDYTDIPNYPQPSGKIKIPAAWLIQQCGWKGKRIGDCGSHKNQPLVLVNYGNAKGKDIFKLAMKIQKAVLRKFKIKLTPEVNVW